MENTNKKPIIEKEINLSYSKGFYQFFTKTCATIFLFVIGILENAKIAKNDFFSLVNSLWIVNHTTNKLEGICSISSSVHDNCICKAYRKIKDCICQYCYAHNQQLRHTGLKEHNIINGLILRNVLIPVFAFKALQIIFPYLRIESFGDSANVTQCRNYIRIIKAQSSKRCAIWSKNIELYNQAFQLEGKPKNTTYVHSSKFLNTPEDVSKYEFVDHVFTVYTKKYTEEHNITINCGGRKCIECIKKKINCYYRLSEKNNTYWINELKK